MAKPIDKLTYEATLKFFNSLLKMLHPFMPFITEELWQHIYERKDNESIMRDELKLDAPSKEELKLIEAIEQVKAIVSGVRTVRNQKNIAPKVELDLNVIGQNNYEAYNSVIIKMANLKAIEVVTEKSGDASGFMVGTDSFAVPVGDLIDVAAEIEKQEKELKHLEGFLTGIKKNSNEKFVANAPEAVMRTVSARSRVTLKRRFAALKASLEELRKR